MIRALSFVCQISILLLSFVCFAASDSIPINSYSYGYDSDVYYSIDTSISNFEEYNFIQNKKVVFFNLGNLGTATYPLTIPKPHTTGFHSGYRQFDIYKLNRDSIRYYHVIRPYVELFYYIGLKNESVFKGRHSQRLGKQTEYGLNFHRIVSDGFFQHQKSMSNHFFWYVNFHSKDERYQLSADIVYNRSEVEENGGIEIDIYDAADERFFSLGSVPVFLENAMNVHRDGSYTLTQSYDLGNTAIKQLNDSTEENWFKATNRLSYQFSLAKYKSFYDDPFADSAFYNTFYNGQDTFFSQLRYTTIDHQFEWSWLGNTKYEKKNLLTRFAIRHQNYELSQGVRQATFNNLSIRAIVESNPAISNNWFYHLKGVYFFTGNNKNDALFQGSSGYRFHSAGQLSAQLIFQRRAPDWVFNNFVTSAFSWQNNFKKRQQIQVSIQYRFEKYQLTLNSRFLQMDNYLYWDESGLPKQKEGSITAWVFQLEKNFAFGSFRLDNRITYQIYNNVENTIQLPDVLLRHRFYLYGYVFKGALLAELGTTIRYYSNFYAHSYQPLTGQFITQDEMLMKFYPIADLFLNMKINTVRIFLKGNNLTQGLFRKGYYSALRYPGDKRSFRAGIAWNFID